MSTKSVVIFQKTTVYLILGFFALLSILPFWLMLVNTTRTNNEINTGISLVPGTALVENVKTLILGRLNTQTGLRVAGINVPRGFVNSFIISASATLLTAYFCSMTAFAFVAYSFRGKKIFFALILGIMMIPSTVSLIGIYKLVVTIGLLDTWWPLILPAMANPFAVFFLRNYLRTALPFSLLEAARIDGASEPRIFHSMVLPLAMPGIATISIFGFLGSWNSYLLPLTIINSEGLQTLPLLIQQLNTTTFNRDLGALYAGVGISIVPVMVAFALFSRHLVAGLASGSVKE